MMNNPSASTNDHTMNLLDTSSDIEIEERVETVTFTSNAKKIEQLVKKTSTNAYNPFLAESYDETGSMVISNEGPWIPVMKKSKGNKKSSWGFDNFEMTEADIEQNHIRKQNQQKRIAEKIAQSNTSSFKMNLSNKKCIIVNPYKKAENRTKTKPTICKTIISTRVV